MMRYSTQTSDQPITHKFQEAASFWNLETLYNDLSKAKQEYKAHPKQELTPMEKAYLRGLLSDYSLREITEELHRELRGLRVDLSRGLYRYIEVLTSQTPRDWKDVPILLKKAGYQLNNSPNSSHQKILGDMIEETQENVLDLLKKLNGGAVKNMSNPSEKRLSLVIGPARSGKSEWAESLANLTQKSVIYIATSFLDPDDLEWQNRVKKHQERRPPHWKTLEIPLELSQVISQGTIGECLLIDSLGTWVANGLEEDELTWNNRIKLLINSLIHAQIPIILVAEETGWGMIPLYPSGRLFRDRLGSLVRQIGSLADDVFLITGGYALNLSSLGVPLPNLNENSRISSQQ